MSKRDWEPGDGAILRFKSGELAYGVRREDEWAHVGDFGGGSAYDDIGGFEVVCPARVSAADDPDRLVIVDPENREQVERLLSAILVHQPRELVTGDRNVWNGQFVDALTAALREFASPTPKPEEPTGLGAVVEDEKGQRWLRWWTPGHGKHPSQGRPWQCSNGGGSDRAYADITAARVLSEGVAP